MPTLKEQLMAAIEAYAAARPTNNNLLLRFAAETLSALLESVDVVPAGDQQLEAKDNPFAQTDNG